jgi:hypothetical protein
MKHKLLLRLTTETGTKFTVDTMAKFYSVARANPGSTIQYADHKGVWLDSKSGPAMAHDTSLWRIVMYIDDEL